MELDLEGGISLCCKYIDWRLFNFVLGEGVIFESIFLDGYFRLREYRE